MMSKREPEYPALPEDVQPPPGSDLKAHAFAWASAMGRGLVSAEDAIAAGEALLVLRRLTEPDTATDASD